MIHKTPQPNPGDEWSERLRASMRKDRRRYYAGLVALAVLVVALVAGFIWWIYPSSVLPRLAVVAFDQISLPEEKVPLQAQLEAMAGDPVPGYLGGLTVAFLEARSLDHAGDQLQTAQAKTQGAGQVFGTLQIPRQVKEAKYQARLLDSQRKLVSEDTARIFFLPAQAELVLVNIGDLVNTPGPDWSGNLANVHPHLEAAQALHSLAKKDRHLVYLALDSDRALGYRQRRRWLDSRQIVLPLGPVLGRPSYHEGETEDMARQKIVADLLQRFKVTAVAQGKELARSFLKLKVPTVVIGDEQLPEAFLYARSWKEVPEVLGKTDK
jgi:hypothetical protein